MITPNQHLKLKYYKNCYLYNFDPDKTSVKTIWLLLRDQVDITWEDFKIWGLQKRGLSGGNSFALQTPPGMCGHQRFKIHQGGK